MCLHVVFCNYNHLHFSQLLKATFIYFIYHLCVDFKERHFYCSL